MGDTRSKGGKGSSAAMGGKSGTARLSVRVDRPKGKGKQAATQSRAQKAKGSVSGLAPSRTTGGVIGATRKRG